MRKRLPEPLRTSDGVGERAGEIAGRACRGLAAGAVGTAAMTISSTIEAKLRRRGASDVPAQAAGKVLRVEPSDEEGKERFSNAVHWSYGIGWGSVRGLLDAAGVGGPRAAATHLGLVWGTAAVMLPGMGLTPPVWKWGVKEVGIDLFHHGVYAAATDIAYEYLDGRGP